MKALTVCQPFADLICLPDDDDRNKRVENRTWPTSYRGLLLIHAGKNRKWLQRGDYGLDVKAMTFGAIIGIADLRDCVQVRTDQFNGRKIYSDYIRRRWPWMETHQHVEGEWCWVLQEVRRFKQPIPYKGAQGLFEVPREVVTKALEELK